MIGPYKEDSCINMWPWPRGILVAMAAVVAMEIDGGRASNGVVSVYILCTQARFPPHSHSRPSLEIS